MPNFETRVTLYDNLSPYTSRWKGCVVEIAKELKDLTRLLIVTYVGEAKPKVEVTYTSEMNGWWAIGSRKQCT